ncbi:hypothetical protein DH2020_021473 [Rehmannia glutinosa]|uniref:Cytochrome P450 n=1 Tax=Rehmannia glutinosa TaxID=99300 RepID=A0ABR0WAI4_REHGL
MMNNVQSVVHKKDFIGLQWIYILGEPRGRLATLTNNRSEISHTSSKKLNLPPGPPGYPVVGNLFQVARSGKPFFQYVRELIPKYGPIMTLKMGTRTMIIISGADLAKEALIEKGQVFASRPRENPTRTIFSCNKFTVNAALYGPVWRSLRRNMVQNALSAARLREFRHVRDSAMDKLVDRLKSEAAANDGVVWVLRNASGSNDENCAHGSRSEIGRLSPNFEPSVLQTMEKGTRGEKPANRNPSPPNRKEAKRRTKPRLRQNRRLILIPRHSIRSQNRGPKIVPSNPEIVTLCSEFLNGGTDTTATAVEWAVARMIENPEIQTRLYDEIRTTVGGKKVDEKDVEKMPYLNAVVKELLRKHPPTYFSLTHAVTEPAKLGGYDIPTDTNVEFFLPGISEDPNIWSDPEKFDPDRFFAVGRRRI